MRTSRVVTLAILAAAAVSTAACGSTRQALGMEKVVPDEFRVVSKAPLVVPPDYAVRPPAPGEPRPQELAPESAARNILLGQRQGAARSEGEQLKKHEPKNYQRLATVLLPHDYLNFWLTGERVMEYGDASGTELLDVRKRKWATAVLKAIDPDLAAKLPPLISSEKPAGLLRATTAKQLGLNPGVLVSAGGGDNMMGAIGTGNTRAGVITASFGTSGTIYACAQKPVVDPQGEIAAFCDSTNRWLPLLCTMNVTVATELVREDFGWSHEKYDAESARIPAGSHGLVLVPYFEGERTPNVPDGTGVWFGVNQRTFEAGHFARAAMEGVSKTLVFTFPV